MTYPPHVQRLLENLSPEQESFQRTCIGLALGLQVLAGMAFAFAGLGSLVGLYLVRQPFIVGIYAALTNDVGALAAVSFPAACVISLLVGMRLIRG